MINQLLKIKNIKRELFKRHFIRNVILEFTFSNFKKEILLENIEKIKDEFKKLGFSRSFEIKQIEFKMTSEDDAPEKIQNDKTIGLLLFNDENKIRIELLENKMIISVFKYLNFDKFIIQIQKMVSILKEIISELDTIIAMSLKKQNTIISTDTKSFDDIGTILNKSLLAPLREKAIPFENFDFSRDEFGVIKNSYRCKISSDCKRRAIDEFEINLSILVINNIKTSLDDMSTKLKEINDFNFSVFCWATTEEFKKIMNQEVL